MLLGEKPTTAMGGGFDYCGRCGVLTYANVIAAVARAG
jgi:hypothetical protein